ncbi:MAG: hypothetical protein AAGK77_07565, partial [Pseudomonadota bacterium]
MNDASHPPGHSMPVYRADSFVVSEGANLGDPLTCADDLMLDDVYTLAPAAQPLRLALHTQDTEYLTVADGGDCSAAGAVIHLDCALTLMSPDGQTTDAIVLVEVDAAGHIAQVYLLPLAALAKRTPYALVGPSGDMSVRAQSRWMTAPAALQ